MILVLVFLGGSSCLDPIESPSVTSTTTQSTIQTTTTLAPTTAPPTTTATVPATTTTEASVTTTTAATTTATTFPTEVTTSYLKRVLTAEMAIGRLVEEIVSISNDWDNRSETDVTYSETETAMEDAVARIQAAGSDFELIEPPPTEGFPEEHRTVRVAAGQVVLAGAEMLAGLQSSDSGEQRRSAQVGLNAAYGVFVEGIDRIIAEYIGDEEITALIVARTLTVPAPVPSDDTDSGEETATTTTTTTTTEAG